MPSYGPAGRPRCRNATPCFADLAAVRRGEVGGHGCLPGIRAAPQLLLFVRHCHLQAGASQGRGVHRRCASSSLKGSACGQNFDSSFVLELVLWHSPGLLLGCSNRASGHASLVQSTVNNTSCGSQRCTPHHQTIVQGSCVLMSEPRLHRYSVANLI